MFLRKTRKLHYYLPLVPFGTFCYYRSSFSFSFRHSILIIIPFKSVPGAPDPAIPPKHARFPFHEAFCWATGRVVAVFYRMEKFLCSSRCPAFSSLSGLPQREEDSAQTPGIGTGASSQGSCAPSRLGPGLRRKVTRDLGTPAQCSGHFGGVFLVFNVSHRFGKFELAKSRGFSFWGWVHSATPSPSSPSIHPRHQSRSDPHDAEGVRSKRDGTTLK